MTYSLASAVSLSLISALLSQNAAAASSAGDGDVIVVSAMLSPTRLSETGSSLSVITAQDIADRQYVFLIDALRDAPGVSVARNGGFGGAASARIRGASSGQTLAVIDGVPVNDPSAPQGGYNFANLDVADIERVEVLRGPQSLIYGPDAIGGVISIITRQGPPSSVYLEGGSRGTLHGGATLAWRGDASFARLTLSGARTDGISRASGGAEADGFRTLAGSFSGGVTLNEHWAARLTARIADSDADIDGFPAPLFTLADTEETEETRESLLAATLSQRWTGYDGALTFSYSAIDRNNFDAGAVTFSAEGDRVNAVYIGALSLSQQARIIAGGELERTSANVSGIDESAHGAALFALVELKPLNAVTLSGGLRRDEFSNFNGATTARLASVWSPAPDLILRASWGQGFRAPSLFELNFDQFGVTPNPDLRPERANGFDLGAEKHFGSDSGSKLSVTFFHTNVRDQIDFDFTGNGYFNIDETRARGVEIEGAVSITATCTLQTTYSFTDAVDKSTGAQLLRQPKHKGDATLIFKPTEALSVSATAMFNGAENDTPAPNASFMRLDLRASYALSQSLELYGRIENLTDSDYQDVSGYGEAGISAYSGVRMRL